MAGMLAESRLLVERLARRLGAEVIETHISWVLLAGDYAYKLKKPVKLPFVDYSSLERREHFCAEEVRLNRRLAPLLYLGVSRVTGPAGAPAIDAAGPTLEYAVRMRRFPAGSLFSEQLAAGTLSTATVDRFAERLAQFHATAPACTAPLPAGEGLPARALAALAGSAPLFDAGQRQRLEAFIGAEASATDALRGLRRAGGHARECHGDLHLANLLTLDGDVAAFDCIEFDPALRCIDLVEEAAFPLMDFCARGHPALGWRFLDGWLASTGEYEGLPLLRLCVAYRALVRAMVEALRDPASPLARRYAAEALHWSAPPRPRLLVTYGLPGSGKSYAALRIVQEAGAIRIRSDVERKRLHGLEPLADSATKGVDIYTPEATRRTYERLFALAEMLLAAGLPVVLDAAFLRADERQAARRVAQRAGVPFSIVACEAPIEVLRTRLRGRRDDASEADAGVLEKLRAAVQPLGADELPFVTGS